MTNNDILKRIRYIFDYKDHQIVDIFNLADFPIEYNDVVSFLLAEEHPNYKKLNDHKLAGFLNGLIVEKRGRQEGREIINEKQLDNNLIFRKLKIAFNLKSDEIVEILKLADFRMSESEINAFFRKPGHDKYRQCKDQVLRNFLSGLQKKLVK